MRLSRDAQNNKGGRVGQSLHCVSRAVRIPKIGNGKAEGPRRFQNYGLADRVTDRDKMDGDGNLFLGWSR